MAATKKSEEIAAKKQALAGQIEQSFLLGRNNLTRVPDFVNCGSHQVAVEWKKRLDQLTGKAPLIEQAPE